MSYSLRADVSMTDTDTGLVLLDERAGTYFQMNATGAVVLHRLLDGAGHSGAVAVLQNGTRSAPTGRRPTWTRCWTGSPRPA